MTQPGDQARIQKIKEKIKENIEGKNLPTIGDSCFFLIFVRQKMQTKKLENPIGILDIFLIFGLTKIKEKLENPIGILDIFFNFLIFWGLVASGPNFCPGCPLGGTVRDLTGESMVI